MGKILNFPKRPKPPPRSITIQLNEQADAAFMRRQLREGHNPSTLVCRAIQVYDALLKAQERGERIVIGNKQFTIT